MIDQQIIDAETGIVLRIRISGATKEEAVLKLELLENGVARNIIEAEAAVFREIEFE